MEAEVTTAPVAHTLFEPCNDVAATRAFYSDALGLLETFHDGDKGWLTYRAGPLQIVFTQPTEPLPQLDDWSRSPAWEAGSVDAPSWVFRVDPDAFDPLVERLAATGAPVEIRTYDDGRLREVFARDPMGKTVEVYAEAGEDAAIV